MKNINNYKVTSSIINKVVVKRCTSSDKEYDLMHEVDDMVFSTFVDYVDNLSTIADVHWIVDFLNPEYTLATVYVTF